MAKTGIRLLDRKLEEGEHRIGTIGRTYRCFVKGKARIVRKLAKNEVSGKEYEIAKMACKRIPVMDREDLVQECVLAIVRAQKRRNGHVSPALAMLISKRIVAQYWRRPNRRIEDRSYANILLCVPMSAAYRQTDEDEDIPEIADSFDLEQHGINVDILSMIPASVTRIIAKRMAGIPLTAAERKNLERRRKELRALLV